MNQNFLIVFTLQFIFSFQVNTLITDTKSNHKKRESKYSTLITVSGSNYILIAFLNLITFHEQPPDDDGGVCIQLRLL